jgi:hypothetical protein
MDNWCICIFINSIVTYLVLLVQQWTWIFMIQKMACYVLISPVHELFHSCRACKMLSLLWSLKSDILFCCRNSFVQAPDIRKGQQKSVANIREGEYDTNLWLRQHTEFSFQVATDLHLIARWLPIPQSRQHTYCTYELEPELTEDGELSYVDYLYLQRNAVVHLRLAAMITVQFTPNMYFPVSITEPPNVCFLNSL